MGRFPRGFRPEEIYRGESVYKRSRRVRVTRRGGFDGRIDAIGAEDHLPYDRPPLSKELLAGKWQPEDIVLRKQGVDDLELDWRLGRAAVAAWSSRHSDQNARAEGMQIHDERDHQHGGRNPLCRTSAL